MKQKKRISFCSDDQLDQLLQSAADKQFITKSLFIRSVLMAFIQKNHSDLVEHTKW